MNKIDKERLDFWNKRVQLGENAGSNDFNLKYLEIQKL